MTRILTASALLLLSSVTPAQAGADWGLGADVGLTLPVLGTPTQRLGYALNVRGFRDWTFGIASVGIEGMGSFHNVDKNITVGKGGAGVRATLGLGFKGFASAHVGYGSAGDITGWTYDLTLGASLKLLPIRIGLYGRLNELIGEASSIGWVDTGVTVEFAL